MIVTKSGNATCTQLQLVIYCIKMLLPWKDNKYETKG